MKDELKIKEGERQDRVFLSKVKGIDAKNHTVDVIMSDASVDRYREVIHPDAWKNGLKNYKKHPVLLSSHNYHGLTNQIGKALKIKVNVKGELEAKMKYFVDKGNEEADWGFFLVEEGIAAYSVGFIPKKYVWSGDGDFEDLAKELGYSKKEAAKIQVIFTEVELLENSQVLVPANPAGLLKGFESEGVQGDAVLKGLYTDAIAKVDSFKDFFATEGAATISKSFATELEDADAEGNTGEGRIRRKNLDTEDIDGLKDTSADSIKTAKAIIAKIKGLSLSDTGIEEVITDEADPDLSTGGISEILKAVKALSGTKEEVVEEIAEGVVEDLHLEKDASDDLPEGELNIDENLINDDGSVEQKDVPEGDEATADDVETKDLDADDEDNPLSVKELEALNDALAKEVVTGMGILLGAAGSLNSPEDERKGLYNQLASQYEKLGKEAPEFKHYDDVNEVLVTVKDSATAIAIIKSINDVEEVEKAPTLNDVEEAVELGLKKIESIISDAIQEFKSLTIKSDDDLAEKVDGFESELSALKSVVTDLGENALNVEEVEVAAKGQMVAILKGVKSMTKSIEEDDK